MLMADVYNRRRQPEKMNEALRRAESYVPAARASSRQGLPDR
jgi:hypothetical protein